MGFVSNFEAILIYCVVVRIYNLCSQDVEKKEDGVVEDIPPEMQIKHPLQNTWTLWYYENDRTKTWEENQREIISFDTAEDFWR